MQSLLIYKFGGTSVKNAKMVQQAADLVNSSNQPLVVVTSAAAGITNLLEADPSSWPCESTWNALYETYATIANDLNIPVNLVKQTIDQWKSWPHSHDQDECIAMKMSLGERLMAPLLAAAIGPNALPIDGTDVISTTGSLTNSLADFSKTKEKSQFLIQLLKEGKIPVVTGFIGSNNGKTALLGRNGSDLSATLMGFALDADEVWIWTDVDGIYTADPNRHKDAQKINEISFRETAEAAYFGAKVLHPYSLRPLLDTNTNIRIKCTNSPEDPGSLICHKPLSRGNSNLTTSVRDVSLFTISGYGMIGFSGAAARIFGAIAEVHANVLMISQNSSEQNITIALRSKDAEIAHKALKKALAPWMGEPHRIDAIQIEPDMAILSIVGANMRGQFGIAGKIFSALGLAKVNCHAIAQGSSEYSISIVVKDQSLEKAIDAILSIQVGE